MHSAQPTIGEVVIYLALGSNLGDRRANLAAAIERLREQVTDSRVSATERRCLEHFLHVTDTMRPQLIQCYDLEGLPRTNNDMEGFIRAIKTRYRRISGRSNRSRGRCVTT